MEILIRLEMVDGEVQMFYKDKSIIWKDLNYKNSLTDTYIISENGDIYSLEVERLLKPTLDKDGYFKISLRSNELIKETNRHRVIYARVATLVCYIFNGEPPNDIKDPTVEHIDNNKINNHYSNLIWMERSLNSSSRKNTPKGIKNYFSIFDENTIISICEQLQNTNKTIKEIGDMFGIEKSTISNIKSRKSWTHISKDYIFKIHKQKSKKESLLQRLEINKLLKNNIRCCDIIKMGYPSSVVYRLNILNKSSTK